MYKRAEGRKGRVIMNSKLITGIAVALMFVVMNPGNSVFALTTHSEMVEEGRYLSKIAGCNDCHTPGYLLSEGKIPEKSWLIGDRFGWRGPWGTTYAVNLRIFMSTLTEDQWVSVAKKLKARPPMPWFDVNEMKEEDLRDLYQFIRSFKLPGEPAHPFVPPGVEPDTPYALFPSPPEEGKGKKVDP
jgi:mono/diheme cytochrome c family protein